MLGFIIRRVLSTIPVMVIVALFVFSLLYIAPGDPAVVIAGDQATPEDVEKIRKALGLDRPFLERFGEWSWRILRGDLGTSMFTGLPVTQLIAQRLEPTLSLMVVTLLLAIVVATEIAQLWLPGQTGSITDIAVGVAIAFLFYRVDKGSRRAPLMRR